MNKPLSSIFIFHILFLSSICTLAAPAPGINPLQVVFGKPIAGAFDEYQRACEHANKEELASLSITLKDGVSFGYDKGGIIVRIAGEENKFFQPQPGDYSWTREADQFLKPHGFSSWEALAKLMQATVEMLAQNAANLAVNRYDRSLGLKAEFRFINAFDATKGEVSITVFDTRTNMQVDQFRGPLGSVDSKKFAAPFEYRITDIMKTYKKEEL